MRDYVFPSKRTRLLAYLHIGAIGLALNPVVGGELQDVRLVDVDRTADAIKENPGFLIGVKVRMFVNAMPHWEAHRVLKQAREAADKAKVKLMVHVSGTPIPLPEILEVLGPGDIATHIFNGHLEGILDKRDAVRPEVLDAAQRGVVMDVAHAGVHCDVEVAQAAMRQGLFPTTISTDIHIAPPGRTVYRQNDLVSKFHAMGMPLEDAVAAGTVRPARVLGLERQIGSLAPGMAGDVAVFDRREGRFVWHDMSNHSIQGKMRLDTFMTLRDGEVAWQEGRLLRMGEC
jgi:dihydroorotase